MNNAIPNHHMAWASQPNQLPPSLSGPLSSVSGFQPDNPSGSSNPRFAIGLDLGTTFSGGTVKASKPGFRHTPYYWIEGNAEAGSADAFGPGPKAPTRLALYPPSQGASEPHRWGYQVSDDEESFRWFKLGLVHEDELHEDLQGATELDEARALRSQHKAKVSELVEIYMRKLWGHTVQQIASQHHMTGDQVVQAEIHVVLGVPANWKSGTRLSLLKAARAAGIPGQHPLSTVETYIEPEAATIALVEHGAVPADLTSGDIITICDCGGGKSDAISFEIQPTQPFVLDGCVPAEARFCGSVQLESLFMQRLKSKIQALADPDKAATLSFRDIRPLFHRLWELGIKRQFDGSSRDWSEVIPDYLLRNGNRRITRRSANRTAAATVTFTGSEAGELFDLTIRKIIGLVGDQVRAVWEKKKRLPKFVIVCGGFSQNLYLRTKLAEEIDSLNAEYKHKHPSGTIRREVAEPLYVEQAVSTGCAMQAFEHHIEKFEIQPGPSVRIASRIAGSSYGIATQQGFRQFVTQGDSLPVAQPKFIELQLPDFVLVSGWGELTSVSLVIVRGQATQLVPSARGRESAK
ncbi:hypothetical protein C8A03DRAFT_32951 [Achaetomium macrosporum]|uniref:Actin-like ATPase domain-containing protein n=1 Tax=Achaetomium macrosporum TaxID=79813 RepID=A0AAN7HD00_9PEZI|nr:hypothetical protein C8A03DRAFT_32951 [Achaetomium macrosporum]